MMKTDNKYVSPEVEVLKINMEKNVLMSSDITRESGVVIDDFVEENWE